MIVIRSEETIDDQEEDLFADLDEKKPSKKQKKGRKGDKKETEEEKKRKAELELLMIDEVMKGKRSRCRVMN